MTTHCNCNGNLIPSGNDFYLAVTLKSRSLVDGEVVETPFDFEAADTYNARIYGILDGATLSTMVGLKDGTTDTVIIDAKGVPLIRAIGVEVTGEVDGRAFRAAEKGFISIVEFNGEAKVVFTPVTGGQEANLVMTLTFLPSAAVVGKNAYEIWKEEPGNQDKTLADFIYFLGHGESAYEIAVRYGYTGTEAEYNMLYFDAVDVANTAGQNAQQAADTANEMAAQAQDAAELANAATTNANNAATAAAATVDAAINNMEDTLNAAIAAQDAEIASKKAEIDAEFATQTALINQKQMEIGAVPSDLTPTAGSTNWVTSGGVADAIDDITNVNLNGLLIRRNWLQSNNTWNTTGGYHVMINVEGYEQVVVKANSSSNVTVALLTSAARSGTASYATGASRITVLVNEKIALDIPSNAKYLYVIYGADTTYNQKPDYVKLYSNGFSRLDKKMDNYTETVYNASSFTTVGVLKASDGSVQNNSTTQNYRTSDYIPVESDMVLIYRDVFPTSGLWTGICIYNHLGLFIAAFDLQTSEAVNNGVVNLSDYTDVAYIRISTNSEITTATTECKLQKHYTISDVATTIDNLNGKVIRNNYGCGISGNSTEPSNVLYETSNTPCLKAGIVERITGYFKYSGTVTIATGFIDQNGYMIIGKEYNVTIPSTGNNNIDVESKGIYLNEGEYLLAKVTGTCYPNFGVDASAVTGLSVNMEYEAQVRSDNVYFCFGWVVRSEIPDYDTLSDNVAAQEREIESLQETIANIDTSGVITDSETGTPYKITIRNGQIVLVPTLYSNVLVLGNSITVHPLTSIWPASDRGMAATKPEYDFCGIMQTQMRLKDNATVVTRLNIADWERDFTTDLSTLIGNNLTSNTDLVVIRLGENVTNNSGFGTALNNVLSYIYGVSPNARVVVTSMFWASSAKDEILKSFADSHGLTYVKINQFGNSAYEEAIGHYTYNTDFTAISEITNSGVAQHPSNKGMCAIANEILNALGYEKSTNTYTLQSVTIDGTTGSMYVLNT